MKLFVTSDNHLGFKETDPVRAEDTFNTFDEILSIAKREKADIVIQGGDLFHENKPSRNTYNRTVQLLKKHCLGTSMPNFNSSIPMNTDDPNMKISLPILSIHGNHDDPSGFNSVSPHDILNSTGLVNYIGRIENVDDMRVDPVLIYGDRKIAIYAIGHIKDRRIYNAFLSGKVRYSRPVGDDWVSILVVHQNRVFRKDEYLPEDLIDPFIDLVIYGHEHESLHLQHRNFDVIQCGSSVRTSLCEGEAGDKFAYIVDVTDKMRINRIKLETVRPFVMDSIKIMEGNADLIIRDKMDELLEKAKESGRSRLLPLLRLRVELGEKVSFNKHGLLVLLEKKLANPEDALRITRKAQKEVLRRETVQQRTGIEEIYKGILDGCQLKALVQERVIGALVDFVDKDGKDAFNSLVKEGVHSIVDSVNLGDLAAENIEDAIQHARHRFAEVCTLNKTDEELNPDESGLAFIDSSVSICGNASSSMLRPPTSSNYTFIEDKLESMERQEVVKNAHIELEQAAKKQKTEDDLDDLFGFDRFMYK